MNKKENIFTFTTANATGFLLYKTHQYWQREIKRRLKPIGITHTQFVVLANTYWLYLQDKQITQIAIAKHTKMDVMMVSNVIRTLEKKGFLKRTDHPTDTRAKLVKLTETGFDTLKKAVVIVENFDRDFFKNITNPDTFNQELSNLLKNE
jgi:DNA-binding MarR family transcriptional regulator